MEYLQCGWPAGASVPRAACLLCQAARDRQSLGEESLYPDEGECGCAQVMADGPREALRRRLVERDGARDRGWSEVVRLREGPGTCWSRGKGVVRHELRFFLNWLGPLGNRATSLRARRCLPESVVFRLGRWGGGGCLTVFGRRSSATAGVLVEDEGGGATLEPRVAALAGPVPFARLA